MPNPTPRAIGEAVLKSFHRLLERDLNTQPVQNVFTMLSSCLCKVDPQLSLHTFGSAVVYGFQDPAADVDFVVLRPEDRQSTRTLEDAPGSGDDCDAATSAKDLSTSSPVSSGVLPRRPSGMAPAPKHSVPAADATSQLAKGLQLDCLGRLETELRRHHDATWHINLVRRARVPVLRANYALATARDGVPYVDFDVTAHRRNGVRNSVLLQHYYTQAPSARWLGLAVKTWSKQVGLNGLAAATEAAAQVPSSPGTSRQSGHGQSSSSKNNSNSSSGATASALMTGCLTSYAFNLMVVYFLLRRGHVQFVEPEQFLDITHVAPVPTYVPLQAPPSASELGDLVIDFAHFYRREFDAAKEVVSLSRAAPTSPLDLGWTRQAEDRARMSGEKVNYRLCIEDPYEINLNVGRFVTPFKFMLWQKHIEKAEQTGLLFSP